MFEVRLLRLPLRPRPFEKRNNAHVDKGADAFGSFVCGVVVVEVEMVDAYEVVVPDPFFDVVL